VLLAPKDYKVGANDLGENGSNIDLGVQCVCPDSKKYFVGTMKQTETASPDKWVYDILCTNSYAPGKIERVNQVWNTYTADTRPEVDQRVKTGTGEWTFT
jgi:hypothetical protein